MTKTKLYTLALIQSNGNILLGMKKRGFGVGRWNGFGGKVHSDETVLEAAKRYANVLIIFKSPLVIRDDIISDGFV